MIEQLKEFFRKNYIRPVEHNGIHILIVENQIVGSERTELILTELLNNKTSLFLSGGSTPKLLYENLAREQTVSPAVVGMIDERFGLKGHISSNEKMIHDTGFLNYLVKENITFYPILQNHDKSREKTAQEYDETARYLLMNIPRSIGILGLGKDGHTAGIAPNREASSTYFGQVFKNSLFQSYQNGLIVSEFNDSIGPFKERITFTFHGLSMFDLLIVLIFGEDKKQALKKLFEEGSEQEIPGRFYKRPLIAKKTLFITDQSV